MNTIYILGIIAETIFNVSVILLLVYLFNIYKKLRNRVIYLETEQIMQQQQISQQNML